MLKSTNNMNLKRKAIRRRNNKKSYILNVSINNKKVVICELLLYILLTLKNMVYKNVLKFRILPQIYADIRKLPRHILSYFLCFLILVTGFFAS